MAALSQLKDSIVCLKLDFQEVFSGEQFLPIFFKIYVEFFTLSLQGNYCLFDLSSIWLKVYYTMIERI